MSLHRRLKALETVMAPPKPGARIFLDDEPTFEVTGVSWCQGYEQKHLDRLDGEPIQNLKESCLHKARHVSDGIVFLMDYSTERRADHELD
ncbi:hypothetical protein [uncultured Desulfobacter sp.]|uniref:hypothetical protein n=1 Tax=uncultured Desulfobacter sp. TaxID=240139 RepID=UPI002AA7944A|nr:hypothetical protein [uncultured Desulfobacter sp.]